MPAFMWNMTTVMGDAINRWVWRGSAMSMVMGGLGAMMRAAMDAFLGSLMLLTLLPPSQQQLLRKVLYSGRGLSTGPGSVLPGCSGRRGLSTGSARAPGLAHRRQHRLRMFPEEFLHLVSAGSGDALCARRRRRVGAPTP